MNFDFEKIATPEDIPDEEYISVRDPEYLDKIKKTDFGSNMLGGGRIGSIDKELKNIDDPEKRKELIFESLYVARHTIIRDIETYLNEGQINREKITVIIERLTEYFEDEFIQDLLRDEELTINTFDPASIKAFFESDDLNPYILRRVFELHREWFNERLEEYRHYVEENQMLFRERLNDVVASGYLPENSIDLEIIDEYLELINYRFKDPLYSMSLGDFSESTATVGVNVGHRPEQVRRTQFHELVHAISGKSVIAKKLEGFTMRHMEHYKVGLSFVDRVDLELGGKKVNVRRRVHNWLNEALTDELALEILGDDRDFEGFHEGYPLERLSLYQLEMLGVSRASMWEVFFENGDLEGNHPHWDALVKEIEQKAGADYLENMSKKYDRAF